MNSHIMNLIEELNVILKPYRKSYVDYLGHINPLGSDVSEKRLKQIESLRNGLDVDDPSIKELAFWRWVAFEGYDDLDPRLFKYKQAMFMTSVFGTTGWQIDSFENKNILEVGCGPYGMIEIFPEDSFCVAFDPLNDEYDLLFSKIRSKTIEYKADWNEVANKKQIFDLAICFNVLDHTDDPEKVLAQTMSLLKDKGKFIIQVNTVRDGFERMQEHKEMHPSQIKYDEIIGLLSKYCGIFKCEISNTPSSDNEFWFMAWGQKL